jgi:hypothetical protein
MWCFCGESMVDCVVIVERRHHVATRLKTCHEFEVYFRVRCGKAAEAIPSLGMVHQRTQRESILCADPGAVLAIVKMVSTIEERTIAVHVWMVGVGFIVLLMAPFFIAMHSGNEDVDD